MVSLIKKVTNWVLYPWLLTFYPVIYLYSTNFGDVRDDDVLEVVFVALMTTTVMYVLCYLLTHNSYKAGAVTGIMALAFLTYGHLYNALDHTDLGQKLLMPVMLVMVVIAIVLILRSKAVWQQLTPYLNLICMFLVIIPLLQVIRFGIDIPQPGATALANPLERVVSTSKVNNSPDRPDIYYIILDGYSSNEFWLHEYGYDNSDFTDALEDRGFYVAYQSKSSYGATMVSLPSTLNMRYLNDDDRIAARQNDLSDVTYLRSMLANNQVAYDLKQMGYTYIYTMSGYLAPSLLADVNIVFYPEGQKYVNGNEFNIDQLDHSWAYKQPFWTFFLETTMLHPVVSYFVVEDTNEPLGIFAPERVMATFEEVEKIPEMEESTFAFVHIIKPHCPIIFDRDGNSLNDGAICTRDVDEEAFFDQLHYINSQVLDVVDFILAESSVPPIIILQADHGTDLGYMVTSIRSDGTLNATYFEVMNAFYFPNNGDEALYPTIPTVNTFRVLFNQYFGGEYELLESRQYNIPNAILADPDWLTFVLVEDD
jgi:hypothetical protein